ncbi:apoptogenic protein 1, mitochondrial-like isoform X2 [Argonauta hians]
MMLTAASRSLFAGDFLAIAKNGSNTSKRFLNESKSKQKFKIQALPPKNISRDWVGPPDGNSNLRSTHFYVPPDESNTQRELRLKREQLQKFNHDFWTRQNITFFKKKAQFIHTELERKQLKDTDSKIKKNLSAEEMAVFYKQFLEENYHNNLRYHRDWYKQNICLLWPALKVAIQNLFKKQTKTKKS